MFLNPFRHRNSVGVAPTRVAPTECANVNWESCGEWPRRRSQVFTLLRLIWLPQ